jgi:hypothetical protein
MRGAMIPVFLAALGWLVVAEDESRRVSGWMAIHEAGHALVGRRILPETPVLRATIDDHRGWGRLGWVRFATPRFSISLEDLPAGLRMPLPDPDGVTRVDPQSFPLDLVPSRQRWGLMMMALGGIVAETVHFGRPQGDHDSYDSDLQTARTMASSLPGTAPPWSLPERQEVARVVARSPEDALRLGYVHALRIVRAEIRALRWLAARLEAHGTLGGPQIHAALGPCAPSRAT